MLNNLTRRDMLKKLGTIGAVGVTSALLPSWMPKLAFAQEGQNPSGDVLVCIFQRGGMDGLSAVVPFGDGAHYYDVRPTIAIAEPGRSDQSAVDLDGQFGLHPALRPLKDIYDNGDFAIVHATGSTDETRSHFDAMMFMEYGTPGDKTTESGWLARHLQSTAYRSNSPFRAIGMGAMLPASLRGPVDALAGDREYVVEHQQRLHPFGAVTVAARILPPEAVDQQREAAGAGLPAHLGDREDRILGERRDHRKVLGVEGADATGNRAGAAIISVQAGSPAALAGLTADDVVIAADGNQVSSMIDLAAEVRTRQPGDEVELKVVRDGEERTVTVTLGTATTN